MIFIMNELVIGVLNVGGLFKTYKEKEQAIESPHKGPTDNFAVIVYVAAL